MKPKCLNQIFKTKKVYVMKKLMIISLLLVTSICYSNLQAQSISRLRGKVERLEKKIEKQNEKVEEQKKEVEKAKQKVQDKIEKDKEAAKDNPKDHGTNEELDKLREELKEEQEKLEKERKKLDELKDELKEAKRKLEEKLKNAVDDILKKNPIPDNPEELDNYEKKMKKLETNPRNSKTEAELRKRIQERIDAKRKELEEHGALPGSQNKGFHGNDSNWRRISDDSQPISTEWTVGGNYTTWFSQGEKYPDEYFEDIKKEAYSNAELAEKLINELGEFHIGSISASGSFTNYEYKKPQFFGINGAYWMIDNFGIEMGLAKGCSSISAEFPVTIFNFSDGSTDILTGKLTNTQDIYEAHIYAQFRLYAGLMKFLLSGGIDYQYFTESELEAIMGGERFPINTIEAQNRISPRAQLGLQMNISKKVLLEAKMNTKLSEKKLELGTQLGIQYRLKK
jgi:hypothetical protein